MKSYPNPEMDQEETEPLEIFNKILVATQAITFMASQVSAVNNMKKVMTIDFRSDSHREHWDQNINDTDAFLNETAVKLVAIAEDLGNYLDGRDMCSEGHESKILSAAFDAIYDRQITK